MPKTRSPLRIPLAFEDALSSLLQVKPPAKEKPVEKAKRPAKKRAVNTKRR